LRDEALVSCGALPRMTPHAVRWVGTPWTLLSPATASADPAERSLNEFLAAQGTFCVPNGSGGCNLFFDPLPNFLGWQDDEANRCALVDYAGLADAWLQEQSGGAIRLGTTVTGWVKEKPLSDGGAEITSVC